MRKPRDQDEGEPEPEHCTGYGEHQAFHEQLAHDAAATCPECATYGKFLRARGSATQEEVGEVHAGDQ